MREFEMDRPRFKRLSEAATRLHNISSMPKIGKKIGVELGGMAFLLEEVAFDLEFANNSVKFADAWRRMLEHIASKEPERLPEVILCSKKQESPDDAPI